MKFALLLAPLVLIGVLPAQTTRMVRASGSASVSVKPDQARVTIGVDTRAGTAQEAAAQNATQTAAVLAAVNQVLGGAGTTQTVGYTISAFYNTATPASVAGYSVSNTIEVTTTDLNLPGRIIDAATPAGANRIQGLGFGLQDDNAVRSQALSAAAKQARSHADAIAAGLGGHTGDILTAQETSVALPVSDRLGLAATTPTPIVTGLVTVSASVTVDVQFVP